MDAAKKGPLRGSCRHATLTRRASAKKGVHWAQICSLKVAVSRPTHVNTTDNASCGLQQHVLHVQTIRKC